jgi:anti-sigma regulatory factor (Ser/Thr protein kinase)
VRTSLNLELPAVPEAAAVGRDALFHWCEDLGIDRAQRELVRLLASELITNVVRHSGAASLRVAAVLRDDEVLVTVTDAGTAGMPALREPDLASGGFGLHMLAQESSRWGVERANGTCVWFTLGI